MGLLAKLLPKVGRVAQQFGGFIPGVGPVVSKVGGILAKLPGKKIAAVVGAGAGFELGGRAVRGPSGVVGGAARARFQQMIDPRTGRPFQKKRRAGLSGRDILGAQKVARVVQAFGYKPKMKKRKRGR
jgi:hypothetical protein